MESLTIAGQSFQAPVPYAEGHELTANEASALNQTFHENLRNNFAKKVKEGLEAGVPVATLQEQFNEYAANYRFGERTGGGGGSRDPIQSEAMNIARTKVKEALRKAGKKISDFEASAINGAAKALIEKDPSITELAKQRVAQVQEAATGDLGDVLSGLTPKPAEPAQAPAQ